MAKKICQVFFGPFPEDSRIRRYVNTLLESGFEVFVVCTGKKSDGFFDHSSENLRIYRFPLKKHRSTTARRIYEYLLYELYSFFMVTYIFFRYRVHIFHFNTLPDFLVFSGVFPKLFGGKIILDFHELFPEAMTQHQEQTDHDTLVVKVLKIIEKLSYRFADRVIAFHDPAKEILTKRNGFPEKITVVMNGVDPSEMPRIERRPQEKFVIVYNGTINYNLNLELVVEALARLKAFRRNIYETVEFDLFGDGPDLENIMSRAAGLGVENVFYKGRLPFGEMMKQLSCASVCVLPPKKEVYSDLYYSLKLTEMIYLKIPVIATRLNTYLRYYPEGCLYYFNSGDVTALEEMICHVYGHPEESKVYAERAWKRYEDFSWPIMKARYAGVVEKLS